jgi:quinol monooxygenase YgiN
VHVVIRKYTASPEYVDEARATLDRLEQTMRSLPGFVAYYFVETDDGITTITVTEDETGTGKSMGMAESWIKEETPIHSPSAPEVTQGSALISATR